MDSEIRVANAPCSWGVVEFEQFSNSRSYTEVLSEMQLSGYRGTELGDWGFMPTDPHKLRETLEQHSLDMVGAFVPLSLQERGQRHANNQYGIKVAQLLSDAGYTDAFIVLSDNNGTNSYRTTHAGRIVGHHLTAQQWRELTDGVTQFARTIYEHSGLKTVFHHHCAGCIETPSEVEKLLADTPADMVGLCLDTGHYAFAGGFPEAACALFSQRIWHVHFKDCSSEVAKETRRYNLDYFTAVKRGIFCELGEGMVAFDTIVDILHRHNYSGWIVVEQDILPNMGSPLACATKNRNYLHKLGV